MKGEKGAVIDYEHMDEIYAGTDLRHVISFDRPAHPSTFWLGDLRGWGYYELSTHSPQLPLSLSVSPSFLCHPFFFSLPLPPTHLFCSLSSAWPGLRCLPPSCIPLALRWAWACLEQGGTGNVNITQLPTHTSNGCRCLKKNIPMSHLQGKELLVLTITAASCLRGLKSYHKWECSPCGLMTPLGFGHTHNSTV